MNNLIVGLVGKVHSGKTTVEKHLVEKHQFKSLAFADHLKWLCSTYYNIPLEKFYVVNKEPQVRMLMQCTSDLVKYFKGAGYFSQRLHTDLKSFQTLGYRRLVVTDVRYIEEYNMLRSLGAKIIFIKRPNAEPIEYGANHSSETEMDKVAISYPHVELMNDGTIDDMIDWVDCYLGKGTIGGWLNVG